MKLTPQQFGKLFPGLTPAKCVAYLYYFEKALAGAGINTRARAAAFVAQLGHESNDLAHLREIWGPTPAQNRYDVRADLGNTPERDGDGKLYLGRGGLQRTGKKNYQRFKDATGLDVVARPELLERPEFAFVSDALFWNDHNLNRLADQLTLRGDAKDLATFDKITRRINGGYNGRVDRQRRYLVALATLTDAMLAPAQTSALDTLDDRLARNPASKEGAKHARREPDAARDEILLNKLTRNQGAQNVARGLGFRLARPAAALLAALEARNLAAWIGTVAVLAVIGWIAYRERAALRRQLDRLLDLYARIGK